MIENYTILKIAQIFFDEPTKNHYLRELCKKSKISPASALKFIEELLKSKIIKKEIEIKGSRKFPVYFSNLDSEEYLFLKKTMNYHNLMKSGIAKKINDSLMPNTIVLFGSYLRGEDNENSDIDLYVQCKDSKINLLPYEKKLKRKIQIIFNEDFKSYSNELKNNIINGLVLKGYLEAF